MLPKIQKSAVFQNDLSLFESVCDNLKNEDIKNDMKRLINQLISEVKKIDNFHSDPSAFKDTSGLQSTKDNISNIRKKLHRICKDYNESIR